MAVTLANSKLVRTGRSQACVPRARSAVVAKADGKGVARTLAAGVVAVTLAVGPAQAGFLDSLTGAADDAASKAGSVVDDAASKAQGTADKTAAKVGGGSLFGKAQDAADEAASKAGSAADKAASKVGGGSFFGKAQDAADEAASKAGNAADKAASKVGGGSFFGKAQDAADDVTNKVGNAADKAASKVGGGNVLNKIGNAADKAADQVTGGGENIFERIGDNIEKATAESREKALSVTDDVVTFKEPKVNLNERFQGAGSGGFGPSAGRPMPPGR